MTEKLPMNIYFIQEDGMSNCWQAVSADLAIMAAEHRFILDNKDDWGLEEHPRAYWHRTIFESCALIGELANPDEDRQVQDE